MKKTLIYLTQEQYNIIKQIVKKNEVTHSYIIRWCVDQFIDKLSRSVKKEIREKLKL